ncbi:MAG: ammonium transporter, partial [Alphaproteobacteria bacterium]|nr:ammonium transporter [Alphaproteobacteria bacterium]
VSVQAVLVVALTCIVWIILGYSLAFDVGTPDAPSGTSWLGGARNFLLNNLSELRIDLTIPESSFVIFQFSVALFAPLLLTGVWAERVRLAWMMAFVPLWVLAGYAPVAHWLFADGWLAASGGVDSGGGLVVHTMAGVSALAVALMLKGRNSRATPATPASSPMLMIVGSLLLAVAQFAVYGGIAFEANDAASSALINAFSALSAGIIGASLVAALHRQPLSARLMTQGMLSGLAAIGAGVGYVAPGGALLLGLIGGLACQLVITQFERRFLLDDPGNIFAIHGVGGIIGALTFPVFVDSHFGGGGFDRGTSMATMLGAQAFATGVVVLWAAFVTFAIGYGLTLALPMRVSAEDEARGLDTSTHGEKAWEFE